MSQRIQRKAEARAGGSVRAAATNDPLEEFIRQIEKAYPLRMNTKQTTEVTGLGGRSLRRAIANDELVAIRRARCGSSRLSFPRAAVIAWLRAHAV